MILNFVYHRIGQTAVRDFVFLVVLFVFIVCQKTVLAFDKLPGLKIDKLEDNIYLHRSYEIYDGFGLVESNGLVFIEDKGAFIIDTPASAEDTKQLVSWLKTRGFTIRGSFSTHFHSDSSAGIEWLNSNSIATYASKLTNELLDNAGRALAKNSFDGTSFWLVKDKVEAFYPGAGHTKDNMVVWMPNQKILFGGCFVKSKSIGNLSDAVIKAWPDSVQRLMVRYGNAAMVIPGHGKVGTVSLLENTRRLAIQAQRKN